MGYHPEITHDRFPLQGSFLGRMVKVCFGGDLEYALDGVVVRDDRNGTTIIRLDNGRYVLGTECQYQLSR